jgi:hypothetical protein
MELFGTPDTSGKRDSGGGLGRLSEASLYLSPDEMLKLSEFLAKCARETQEFDLWDHEHFVDFMWLSDSGYDGPDIIVHLA